MPAIVTQTERFNTTVQGPAGGDPRTATSVRAMGSPLASRTLWSWRRLQELLGTYKSVSAVDTATDTLTVTAHGISDAAPIAFRAVDIGSGAAVPTGLSVLRYAKVVDADTLKVSATPGGAALDLVDTGSGDIYVVAIVDGADYLWSLSNGGVLPLGTLRQQLSYIVTNFGRKVADNAWGAIQTFGHGLTFSASGSVPSYIEYRVIDLTDASQDIVPTADEYVCATPVAARTLTVKASTPTPMEGSRLRISRPATGAFNIFVQRDGPAALATLPASTACGVELVYRGGDWRGSIAGAGAVPTGNW